MLYAITTPECVKSTYNKVKDVEEFIKNLKEEHPNITLGKVDLWVLDWTRTGYARSRYIVLKEVSETDLEIIRKVLYPHRKMFKIKFKHNSVVGYIDVNSKEILLSDNDNTLQNIRTYYSYDEDYDSLRNLCWEYRSNLKELVLEKNRNVFRVGELWGWGVKDPQIDFKHEIYSQAELFYSIHTTKEGFIANAHEPFIIRCNDVLIKTDTIVENKKHILIGDNIRINKYMVSTFNIMKND